MFAYGGSFGTNAKGRQEHKFGTADGSEQQNPGRVGTAGHVHPRVAPCEQSVIMTQQPRASGLRRPSVIAILVALVVAGLALAMSLRPTPPESPAYRFDVPKWVPQPPKAEAAVMSPARIELGRHLFYSPKLSVDGSMTCASCHQQARAFTDGQPVHAGVHGEAGLRNVPSLTNLAWMPTLNWANPSLFKLEKQVSIPIFGHSPVEMGMQGKERALFAALDADPQMAKLLRAAYPDKSGFDMDALTGGLAAFVRSILSYDSPFDRYYRTGDASALSPAARRGMTLFFVNELGCSHCHSGLNFTDNFQSATSTKVETGFHNTGLYNLDGKGAYPKSNPGTREITGLPGDEGRFRTPSLRNVALTAPYMHDGSIATLHEVIRGHYAIAGRAAKGPFGASPLRDSNVTGFTVSDTDVDDLVAFLESLTDPGLLKRAELGNPFPQAAKEPAPAR